MSRITRLPRSLGRSLRVFVDAHQDEFRQHFGKTAFQLKHSLAQNPLFTLDQLNEVAPHCRIGATRAVTNLDASWNDLHDDQFAATPKEVVNIPTLMKLSDLGSVNPEYRAIEMAFLRQIQDLWGRQIEKDLTWSTITVFIASPFSVTPFHIDHELNFLCQVSGEKDVCLYDPSDRDLLSHEDIERFYFGQRTGLHYPSGFETHGKVFRLKPGDAVHHPPLAGHWVRNGDKVSISVSLSFCEQRIDRLGRVYQFNYCLRKLGLKPRPPGRSSTLDGMKACMMGLFCNHNPKSYQQAVHSGPDRIKSAINFLKRRNK